MCPPICLDFSVVVCHGFFYALTYFCCLLRGLSGIVIFSCPEAKSGLRYFVLRFFRSDSLRYSSNSSRERGTEQNASILSSTVASSWGYHGGDLPCLLMRSNPLLIFQRSTQHKAGNVIFWIRQFGIFHFTVHMCVGTRVENRLKLENRTLNLKNRTLGSRNRTLNLKNRTFGPGSLKMTYFHYYSQFYHAPLIPRF